MAAAAVGSRSVAFSNSKWPLCVPSLPSLSAFRELPFNSSTHSIPPLCCKSSQIKQLLPATPKGRGITAPRSSTDESSSVSSPERWLLKPLLQVSLTITTIILSISRFNLHQVRSSFCLITRLLTFEPNRRTVSGLHARLEKKGGRLLITDLDSTNGTYIDDKKLRPGAVTTVPPGSCIIFGNHTQKLPFHCITYQSKCMQTPL
ncbi:hypothetical protein B296_00019887 [Ensete ventricosum]|uniref:FHA domain-containing protein n=1 Tax=Ensete ventricosum TaxID=4639 RepID=A0A426YTS4_ENSVE|nr:hypothetical protein B296_00019887 [Ensete ventricosum]